MTNNLLSKSLTLTSLVAILVSASAQGEQLNFDPRVDRPTSGEYCDGFTIIPNTGWQYCEFDSATDTDAFIVDTNPNALSGQPGCFRATDYFVEGDTFSVVNQANGIAGSGGFFAGEPLPPPPDPWADAGWASADYFSARAGLSGSNDPYTIEVTITSNVGIPAGYYVRFDTGKACNPMKAEDLVSNRAIIVTNGGRENEDVFFPDGRAAARSVAPGVTVVMPAE
ncbi:hypothetical protein THII_3478 [Thioploca ingrica]|uniref:Secreted protein n=1 Tax=Thioploca ingrica TaxID=40754 RepID=A0A090AQ82_9GAMM|nr:hypothetical protein THII_3478 [Thioploca ingrica]